MKPSTALLMEINGSIQTIMYHLGELVRMTEATRVTRHQTGEPRSCMFYFTLIELK